MRRVPQVRGLIATELPGLSCVYLIREPDMLHTCVVDGWQRRKYLQGAGSIPHCRIKLDV